MGSAAVAQNTATADVQESVVVSGGDGPASFDELDAVEQTFKGKAKKEEKVSGEKKEAKKPEKKGDSDESEESESKSKAKSESKGKESEESSQAKPRLLKLEHEGKAVELPAVIPVPVKVAGKVESVPLQELINNYSGKVNWDRKNTEIFQQKKKFDESQQVLRQAVQQSHKYLVEEGNSPKLVWHLSQAMGANPKEVWAKAYENIKEFVENNGSLPEEARQLHELELENEFLKSRTESAKKAQSQSLVEESMKQGLSLVMETHGLDEGKVVELFDELKENGFKDEDIDPLLLGEYAYRVSTRDSVSSILEDVASDLSEEEKDEAISLVTKAIVKESEFNQKTQTAKYPFTKEEIRDAILRNYGTKLKEN